MPKTYFYHGTEDTLHPALGLLHPGANEIPDDMVEIADACVEAGLLTHDRRPRRATSHHAHPPHAPEVPAERDAPEDSPKEDPSA